MCGRFVGHRSFHELKKAFPIDKAACDVMKSYNVAPSLEVLAIIKHDKENWLDKLQWGLVPFWDNWVLRPPYLYRIRTTPETSEAS